MIDLNQLLVRLKRVSFFLFSLPAIAIIFSLLINNYLVTFKYAKESHYLTANFDFKDIECNQTSGHCTEADLEFLYHKSNDLFNCNKSEVNIDFIYDKKTYDYTYFAEDTRENSVTHLQEFIGKDKYIPQKLEKIKFANTKKLNSTCIKNSKLYWFYRNFPSITNFVYFLKNSEKFSLGTSTVVNPFFYGETSISNIVKRLPIAYFFKPLMYISTILMIMYWYFNNKVARNIQNTNKNFYFFYYGIFSSVFLFLHVLFLGSEIDNEIFQKLRRLIMVLFILFEIVAQVLLVLNLRKNFDVYEKIISNKILNLKYILISFMVGVTVIILTILSFFDLSSRFDYFLEWNYFLILLFFYLLSSFLWKINLNR
tara:strand:- start:424 stop:1530 length:1107 start_codon:yes stop_codon:yes gene_type:complete